MPSIVVSYRPSDSAGTAERIFDELVTKFGKEHVFRDIDLIPLGNNFQQHVEDFLSKTGVLLAIIGPRWLHHNGRRQIEEDGDLIRMEIEIALRNKVLLIPVLVDYASMPKSEGLPGNITEFIFRNAAEVAPGRDFHVHMDRLIRSIEAMLPDTRSANVSAQESVASKSDQNDADQRVPAVFSAVERAITAGSGDKSVDYFERLAEARIPQLAMGFFYGAVSGALAPVVNLFVPAWGYHQWGASLTYSIALVAFFASFRLKNKLQWVLIPLIVFGASMASYYTFVIMHSNLPEWTLFPIGGAVSAFLLALGLCFFIKGLRSPTAIVAVAAVGGIASAIPVLLLFLAENAKYATSFFDIVLNIAWQGLVTLAISFFLTKADQFQIAKA